MAKPFVAAKAGPLPEVTEDLQDKARQLFEFDIESEIAELLAVRELLPKNYVFSHNDLNPANILVRKDSSARTLDQQIVLIDTEYCAFNYPGCDLANLLIQRSFKYSDFNYPLTDIPSPSDDEILIAVKAYLDESRKVRNNNEEPLDSKIEELELLRDVYFQALSLRMVAIGMGSRFVVLMGAHGFLVSGLVNCYAIRYPE